MAVNLGSGVVTISANIAPLRTALVSARYQLSSFVAGTRSIAQAAGFLAGNFLVSGVITLGRAFVSSGQLAADMGETINKLQVIFGAASADVRGFTDRLAADLGYAKRELLDAASAFGAMGRGAGMGAKDAAAFSNEMVQLAVDLRSVENIPFTEAVRKLQSGLAGTTRPLRQYGILLSADMVKQEAYRLGITKSGQALTEQAKVVARASLEFKKAKFAEGDAAATAESMTNLQVAAMGRLENAYTTFGQAMMPIFHAQASGLNRAAKFLGNFVERNKVGLYQFASRLAAIFQWMKGVIIQAFESLRPVFLKMVGVWAQLRGGITGNMDALDGFQLAFVSAIETMKLAAGSFMAILAGIAHAILYVIDYFIIMKDLATNNMMKLAGDLAVLASKGHLLQPRENTNRPPGEQPPPDAFRKEGEFGIDTEAPGKGKKGKVLSSLPDFWEQLQGGVGDVPKQQLKAQQEGNAVLKQINDRLKAQQGNNFAVAGG